VDEGPQLRIHPQDDVAAPAAVAAVGPALGHILGTVQVGAPGPPMPAGAKDPYVVYEIALCHGLLSLCVQIYRFFVSAQNGFTFSKIICTFVQYLKNEKGCIRLTFRYRFPS
jgi:hypothetical protein